MFRSTTSLFLACLLVACGGEAKKDTKPEAKKDAPAVDAGKKAPEPAKPAPEATPPAAEKSEFKPDEAWSTLSGMSHMDRMTKFKDGVTINGAVAKVVDDPAGEYELQLDAGGGNTVQLRFQDFGKAAKDKKLAAGATVSAAKCSPTNPQGNMMAFVGCELK